MTCPLTPDERLAVFRTATSALPHWYAAQIQAGMTDTELAEALAQALGIMGGSGGPNAIGVMFQGAGLKIWGGWDIPSIRDKPLFQGAATIAMARAVYRIADPSQKQLSLF